MLDKALFRKHTKLILYLMSREYFSQKEAIAYSLANNEFKDKDSWENKGQFRDKLISLGLLKKYSYKEFSRLYPAHAEDASKAYAGSYERKRAMLVFDSLRLLELIAPSLMKTRANSPGIEEVLPIKEYASKCISDYDREMSIKSYLDSFILGCSMQRILIFRSQKLIELLKALSSDKGYFEEAELKNMNPYIMLARDIFEARIKSYLEAVG
ncbi:MAG: hypothetical protein HGA85_06440 [Nanoarchaeota archaeon]|nr:hypothetical protein [Nanoarchaeota archaeon]